MPYFFAPFLNASNITGDLFALEVAPPDVTRNFQYTAIVSPDLKRTVFSKQIAAAYGATAAGQQIEITIRQRSHLTLKMHEFDPVPITIDHIAKPSLGDNHIQIGFEALDQFFEIFAVDPPAENPSVQMIMFAPKQHYTHWCRSA